MIVAQFDDNENTLGHIAAITGNAKLFKAIRLTSKPLQCVINKIIIITGDISTNFLKTAQISR